MKKIILSCLFLICITISLFSEDTKTKNNYTNINIGTGAVFEDDAYFNPFNIQLESILTYNRWMGMKISSGLFFPYNVSLNGDSSNFRNLFDNFWGLNVLFGAAFTPVKTSKHFLAISAGIHTQGYFYKVNSSKYKNITFGAGITFDYNYSFTERFFLNLGLDVYTDFIAMDGVTGKGGTFYVGVGLKE